MGGRIVAIRPPRRPDAAQADFAIASLRDFILNALATERGVHPETLMTVIGALAGFAAQQAVWDGMRRSGKPVRRHGFGVVTLRSGERIYCGDLLNGFLVPEGDRDWTLWGLVAAAAVESGVPVSQLPDHDEMFRHWEETAGTERSGLPRVPSGQHPQLTPKQALAALWPRTQAILSDADGVRPVGCRVPAVEHWPAVLAIVACQFLAMARGALDPRLSVRLIMESAIAMSRIDPDSIVEGARAAAG